MVAGVSPYRSSTPPAGACVDLGATRRGAVSGAFHRLRSCCCAAGERRCRVAPLGWRVIASGDGCAMARDLLVLAPRHAVPVGADSPSHASEWGRCRHMAALDSGMVPVRGRIASSGARSARPQWRPLDDSRGAQPGTVPRLHPVGVVDALDAFPFTRSSFCGGRVAMLWRTRVGSGGGCRSFLRMDEPHWRYEHGLDHAVGTGGRRQAVTGAVHIPSPSAPMGSTWRARLGPPARASHVASSQPRPA